MKLNYQTQSPDLLHIPALVLRNLRGWRIEMHLRPNDDHSYSLIALSGIDNWPAELCKAQGPYETRDQGVAARSAIVNQLLAKGFQLLENSGSIWVVQVQRMIRSLRDQRTVHRGNYQFHPDDVL